MVDAEARAAVVELGQLVATLSANLESVSARSAAVHAVAKAVFADVMALSPNSLRYCQTLRERTLDKLDPPGSSAGIDLMREEIERLIADLEAATPR